MLLRLSLPSVSAGHGRFSVSRSSIRLPGTPHARCQHHDAWTGKHDATHQHVPSDCCTRQFGAPSEATVPKILRYCQTLWELVQKVMIDVPSCPTLVRIGTGGCSRTILTATHTAVPVLVDRHTFFPGGCFFSREVRCGSRVFAPRQGSSQTEKTSRPIEKPLSSDGASRKAEPPAIFFILALTRYLQAVVPHRGQTQVFLESHCSAAVFLKAWI